MIRFLIILASFIFSQVSTIFGQELGGMPLNVAMHAQTFILFPGTITDFDISDKENYTCRPRRDNGLIIIPKNAGDTKAMLVITEGNRTHRLSINYLANYDPNKHNLYYDLSSIKTLKEFAKTYQQQVIAATETKAAPEINVSPQTTKDTATNVVETGKAVQVTTAVDKVDETNEWQPLLDAADKAYADKRYEAAAKGYSEVLKMNPGNVHATNRLGVIEKILEILNDNQDQKINEAAEIKKQYDEVLGKANEAFDAGKLGEAKLLYTQALKILPTESSPNARISVIDRMLEERRLKEEAERKRIEEEKKLTEQYNGMIAKGDAAMKTEEYATAEKWFNEALKLKPKETYAKGRIVDIANLKAAKASADREKAILAKAKEEEAKYKAQVAKADKSFDLKNYPLAKEQYSAVLALRPGDAYAKNRMDDIDNLVAAIAKAEKEKEATALAQKLEESYKSAIAKADEAFMKKEYAEAITIYNYAHDLKPDENYAKNRVTEIEKVLSDIAKQAELNKQKLAEEEAKNKTYRDAISLGDKAATDQQWDAAKEKYLLALEVKPDDTYALQKLDWIKNEEARLIAQKEEAIRAEKDQQLKDSIAKAEKLAAEERMLQEKAYLEIIAKGDLALKEGKYDEARKQYMAAQRMLPGLSLAQEKINSLGELEEWMRQEAIKVQMREKEEADRRAYQLLINEADNYFTLEEYDKSKEAYEAALKIQPDAQYPPFRLQEIEKAKIDLALRLSRKGPLTREMLKQQKVLVPLTQPQLYKAYPNISFGNPPPGQRLAADYFIVSDTVVNYEFSKVVLEKPSNIIFSDSSEGVAIHLSGIYFNGGNAYFRLILENFSDKEFLAGLTQMTLKTGVGNNIAFHPVYLTGFPYLLPGHYFEMVVAVRAASVNDDDTFEYRLSDRLNNLEFNLTIPGKYYNSEFSHN
jgi:tetratricopeptide (TPR) repeat protein